MKRIIFFALTFLLLFSSPLFVNANEQSINVIYVKELKDTSENNLLRPVYVLFPNQKPLIINNRVYIPLRDIAELAGANVQWNNDGSITIVDQNHKYQLKIDDTTYTVDDSERKLQSAPIIRNGTTLVHVRIFEDLFDKKVFWNEDIQTVTIQPLEYTGPQENFLVLDYDLSYNRDKGYYQLTSITIKNNSSQDIPEKRMWLWNEGLSIGKFNDRSIKSGEIFSIVFDFDAPSIHNPSSFKILVEDTDDFEALTSWRVIAPPNE